MAFPQILGTPTKGVQGSNSTTVTVTFPSGIQAGELLCVAFAFDGSAQILSGFPPKWLGVSVWNAGNATPATAFCYKIADGTETTQVFTLDASEQGSWVSFRVSSGALPVLNDQLVAAGSSTNSTFYSSFKNYSGGDWLVLGIRAGDGSVQATAPSSNYTLVDSQAGGGTGASVYVQKREINLASGTTETPSALTVATEQWMTLIVPIKFIDTTYPISAYPEYSSTAKLSLLGAGYSASSAYKGQAFNGNGDAIKAISVPINGGASNTGNIRAHLYATTLSGGQYIPTGSPLATSDSIAISSLANVQDNIIFTFPNAYQTTNAVIYAWAVESYGFSTQSLGLLGSSTGFGAEEAALPYRVINSSDGSSWTTTSVDLVGWILFKEASTVSTITESVTATDSTDVIDSVPVILPERASFTQVSNATSINLELDNLVWQPNDIIVAVVSVDGASNFFQPNSNATAAGWLTLGTRSNGAIVTGGIFYRVAQETKTVGGSGYNQFIEWRIDAQNSDLEQASYIAFVIRGAVNPPTLTGSDGSSINSDPPSHTPPNGVKEYLWLATRSGDGSVEATAAPTDFINFLSQAGATGSASTAIATRELTSSSLDPAAFTSASEQWVCFTVAFEPAGNSVLESTSASHSSSVTQIALVAITESVTSTDSSNGTLLSSRDVTETAGQAEVTDGSVTGDVQTITEAASATEAVSTTLISLKEITEAISATETVATTFISLNSRTESTSATETTDGTNLRSASITETTSATETQNRTSIALVSVTEANPATESQNRTSIALVSVTEANPATETQNRTSTQAATATESVTATESESATNASSRSVTELVTATESTDGISAKLGTVTESISATETQDRTSTQAATATESVTATESESATNVSLRSVTETVSATESVDGTSGQLSTIAESVSASETQNRTSIAIVSVTEANPATETQNRTSTQAAAATESVTATDTVATTFISNNSRTEAASATETVDGSIAGSVQTITEPTSASETQNRTSIALVSVTEANPATETQNRTSTQAAAITEANPATETVATTFVSNNSRTEATSATETTDATSSKAIQETASATATQNRTASFSSLISEGVTAIESLNGFRSSLSAASESVAATDAINASVAVSRSITEAVTSTHTQSATVTKVVLINEPGAAADLISSMRAAFADVLEQASAAEVQVAGTLGESVVIESAYATDHVSGAKVGVFKGMLFANHVMGDGRIKGSHSIIDKHIIESKPHVTKEIINRRHATLDGKITLAEHVIGT